MCTSIKFARVKGLPSALQRRGGEDKGGSRKTKGEAIVLQARPKGDAHGLDLWPVDSAVYVWETTRPSDPSDAMVRERKELQITG